MRYGGFLLVALLVLTSAASCGGEEREEILVFVAASLTNVMERLGQQFTEEEEIDVSFNTGGSAALAQQIIRGAPADAFLPAGPEPMNMLEERGRLVPGTRVDLLTNELVLVGSPSTAGETGITSVEDLSNSNVTVAIADPDLAPAGRYAREALQYLGLWERLESRLVPSANVRVAIGYVETGNVDVGLVYMTDAQIRDGLKVLARVPAEAYSPIVYPAGVLESSSHVEAAQKFLAFLGGAEARETLKEHGFIPLDGGKE